MSCEVVGWTGPFPQVKCSDEESGGGDLIQQTLNQLGSQGREYDKNWVKGLSIEDMTKIAETPNGRAHLQRIGTELFGTDEGRRANTALRIADVLKSDAYKNLDPTNRATVLKLLTAPTGMGFDPNPKVVDNVLALFKSGPFEAASGAARNGMVSALAKDPANNALRLALQSFAATDQVRLAPPAQQTKEIQSYGRIFIGQEKAEEPDDALESAGQNFSLDQIPLAGSLIKAVLQR